MTSVRRLAAVAATAPLVLGGIATAAPAMADGGTGGNQLVCFDGESEGYGNGVCRLVDNGAVLKNAAAGDYSGVYVKRDGLSGESIGSVTKLSFKYQRDTAGGAPRFSLAIDDDGDGTYEYFAFADANGCSGGADGTKTNLVDVINDPTCLISADATYANWAEFVAANPEARFATDQVSFIIADQPGNYRVAQVKMGRAAAPGA